MSTTNGHEKSATGGAVTVQATIPASQSIDLLALNFNSPPPTTTAHPTISTTTTKTTTPIKSDQEALLDIFGGPISAPPPVIPQIPSHHQTSVNPIDSLFSSTFDIVPPTAAPASAAFTPITSVTDQHMQFLFQNNEVLVDHSSLRILAKGEYKRNLGRLALEITNKTPFAFAGFQLTSADDAAASSLLKVMVKPLDTPIIQPGTTVQQIVNVECVNEFSHIPQVYVQFR